MNNAIALLMPMEAVRVLDMDDPVGLWKSGLAALDARMDAALALRQEIVATMPPIPNVSLRDTLASLGELRSCYDDLLKESQDILATGKQDNLNSDRYGLVTVVFSLVLFLLGIVSTFKHSRNRIGITAISVALLVFGLLLMFSIPMPAGFDIFHFLGGN